ncbi:aspartate/glutamate racemase family protein [Aureimonas populi]|uniref:Aspartate/glutamate racemase family protein n=1 Tax=Aureimonas populi TaxID=1701758 RepID=A0ABW5CQ87_9HYPH|nr:aspartate/glutamate racemase family protein [Aureimonas populi]
MTRLVLVNPNTSQASTDAMVAIGRQTGERDLSIEGVTAPFGAPLITDEDALDEAARAVLSLAPRLRRTPCDGVIVAAFGDPGLSRLRDILDVPVTGIAEAGMAAAAAGGRRFAVVTTTPGLIGVIEKAASRYGHAALFAGTFLTEGDPVALMAEPYALVNALEAACKAAIRQGDAQAIVIGGGPLAPAARALAPTLGVALIEPVPAAIRFAALRTAKAQPQGHA